MSVNNKNIKSCTRLNYKKNISETEEVYNYIIDNLKQHTTIWRNVGLASKVDTIKEYQPSNNKRKIQNFKDEIPSIYKVLYIPIHHSSSQVLVSLDSHLSNSLQNK